MAPTLPYTVKAAVTSAKSAAWLARTGGRAAPGLRILFYHRVADDGDPLAVPVAMFRRHMEVLAEEGWSVVDVPDAVAQLGAGARQERTVGLSFDDAFRDVAENALPVLERYGFKATVYVATGVTGGRAAFDWYAGDSPRVMSWDEVTAVDGGTLGFEAHTVSHPNLLALDDIAAEGEIRGSRDELEQRLGRRVTSFCYPAGLFGPRERRLAREAGFSHAVSCEPGVNDAATDRFALHRIQIDGRDRVLDFRAKLAGGHDTPLPLRAAYRRFRYGMGATRRQRASSAR